VLVLFADAEASTYELTLFFAAAGLVLSCIVSFATCLRRNTLLLVLFTAPFVGLTFVIVSHRPNDIFLIGLLAVYFVTLISNALEPHIFLKRGVVVFAAFALSILLMGAAFAFAPPGDERRADSID
jgi:hypothetical protein